MAINFPEGTQDLPARVIQVVSDSSNTHATGLSGSTWHTVPNLSVSITPTSTSSKIFLMAHVGWWINSGNEVASRFLRNSTAIGVGSGTNMQATSFDYQYNGSGWMVNTTPLMYLDSPSTTSAITYLVQTQIQGPTGTNYLWFNRGYDTSGTDSCAVISTLTAMEVPA